MKNLVLVCVLFGTILGQSQIVDRSPTPNTQYFPSGVFDKSVKSLNGFNYRWYSGTLSALQEPSLFALRDDKSTQVYRFLWLPSFHLPISVRLTVNTDGSGSIVTRSVDSHAGLLTKPASDTGKLIRDTTIVIDKAQTQAVLDKLQRAAFWSMPTEEEQQQPQASGPSAGGRTFVRLEADGSRWIVEGVRGGEYHVVDRWSPDDSSYSQLCKYLFQLGKVEATLY